MKASTFLKTLIVLVAIGVIAYIVHNSNKAAKINNLVSAPAEQYEFAQHVDSMCATIQASSDLTKANQAYNQIYEELDVYAQIKKNNGEVLIEQTEQDKLFEKAFRAYWVKIEKEAEELFHSNWTPTKNKELHKEINRLIPISKRGKFNRGISKAQQDALKKYKSYFNGYAQFESLLKELENCENAETYVKLKDLESYNDYPYNNLTAFKNRKENARHNAQTHWHNTIEREGKILKERDLALDFKAIDHFGQEVDDWTDKKDEYVNCTKNNDKDLEELKDNLESKFQEAKKELKNLYVSPSNTI